jgi:putative transposase
LRGFSYRGVHRYLLTFCAIERARVFERTDIVEDALQQIRITASRERSAILAYCFMPDHVHLLIEGLNDHADLKQFAKMAKQRSGASHALSASGRLWQEGYWETVLRKDEDARPVARYIFENPVRASLVMSARDYPHLGSDVWTVAEIIDGSR